MPTKESREMLERAKGRMCGLKERRKISKKKKRRRRKESIKLEVRNKRKR